MPIETGAEQTCSRRWAVEMLRSACGAEGVGRSIPRAWWKEDASCAAVQLFRWPERLSYSCLGCCKSTSTITRLLNKFPHTTRLPSIMSGMDM